LPRSNRKKTACQRLRFTPLIPDAREQLDVMARILTRTSCGVKRKDYKILW